MIIKGEIEEKRTSSGNNDGYRITLHHEGLERSRHLSANSEELLDWKVNNQIRSWEERLKKIEDEHLAIEKLPKEKQAKRRTEMALKALGEIEKILEHTLHVNNKVDWNSMITEEHFCMREQPFEYITYRKEDGYPEACAIIENSTPKPENTSYHSQVSFSKVLLGQRKKELKAQEQKYKNALAEWETSKRKKELANEKRKMELRNEQHRWEIEKERFGKQQIAFHGKVEQLKKKYRMKNPEGVTEYCEMVLSNSQYPDSFPQDYEIQYNDVLGVLLVDYELPALKDIPRLKAVKYVETGEAFEEQYLQQEAYAKLYDSAVYQIALRTMHELFEADIVGAVSSINFNGIVTDTNPATGQKESRCIASLKANNGEFAKIKLGKVDPELCFKSFNNVCGEELSAMEAVKPIMKLDKSKQRYIEPCNEE